MRRKLTAAVVAAVMVWSVQGQAVDSRGRGKQADSGAKAAAPESFASAQTYFDRARKLGFPAAGQNASYILKAEFTTRGSSGLVETGTYTDIWVSDSKWRREATLGKSQFARSQDGKKRYRAGGGPDAALLQFVLTAMEPLPATDALFTEADWKVKRDTVDGVAMTRVANGRENPDGTPDPKEFNGFWFDSTGQLVKTYGNGLETRQEDFADFNGVKVARRVEVLIEGKVGMRIDVTALGPAGNVDGSIFKMKGHDWVRQYTFEVR
ncbi:MAG: hypothetical protein ABSG84_15110 [Acidobacteriaceae bacterium]|jgi:hypothetical protein